ncbi:MAG: two-component system response regulator [Myxococcota bacterium]|nr:response regulator [Myxococcota bacterium]
MPKPLSDAVVFAIDDEEQNLALLKRVLATVCRLETFTSADAALAAAKANPPDLFLIDFRMPGRSGTDLLADIRGAGITSPVVFLTAYPEETGLQNLAGSNDVLWIAGKPFDPTHLSSQVSMALALARVRSRSKSAVTA